MEGSESLRTPGRQRLDLTEKTGLKGGKACELGAVRAERVWEFGLAEGWGMNAHELRKVILH